MYPQYPTQPGQPPMTGAYPPQPPSQPFYPQYSQQPPYPSQQPYPQQPPYYPGAAPSQPLAAQQPPGGYPEFPGYPGGATPSQAPFIRTNVAEYWRNAKNGKRNLSILATLTIIFFVLGSQVRAQGGDASSASTGSASDSQRTNQTTTQSPTNTPVPTAPPQPTESPARYRSTATAVTVSDIAKDPNAYKGQTITFKGVIANFVQDSSGNTAGANVDDPNDYSSVVQIAFTPGFSLNQVNKGDTIEVWGAGLGAFSGTNAFGATITEGGVREVYLHDFTSGYSDNSVSDPASFAANS